MLAYKRLNVVSNSNEAHCHTWGIVGEGFNCICKLRLKIAC